MSGVRVFSAHGLNRRHVLVVPRAALPFLLARSTGHLLAERAMSTTVNACARRVRPTIALVLAAAALVRLTGCNEATAPPAPAARAQSDRIGWLGKGYRTKTLAVSRDLERLAWVDQREDGCRVVVDRRRGERFAGCGAPQFAPDDETVWYFVATERTEPLPVHLVVNGKRSPVELGYEGRVAFAKNGDAWAAIAPTRVPGDAPKDAPAENAGTKDATPEAAPPPRVVAFGPGGAWGDYPDATAPAVGPDGAHAAWIATDTEGLQSLIVDGKVARAFGRPKVEFLPAIKETRTKPSLEPEAMVRALSDGRFVGVALGEQGWTVFRGDETLAAYQGLRLPAETGFQVSGSPLLAKSAIQGGSLVTAAETPVACWWERLEGDAEQWRVVCDGKPVDEQICSAPAEGQPITLTPDGRTAMYVCKLVGPPGADGKPDPQDVWVVVGGQKRGPHRFVWGLDLSADGRHSAFAAADSVQEPWFYDFDGKRFTGPWQHAFPPKISPDGASVAWAASPREDGTRVDLVRDGDIVARGDMVMAPPRWRDDGKVEFALKRGRSVRRVVID